MIKTAIYGGAGYVGGEVLRLLLNHPTCDLISVSSVSQTGKRVDEVHPDLIGQTDIVFSSSPDLACDLIFLCGGHGSSQKFMDQSKIDRETSVIDLSRDFRISSTNHNFVYGLSELNKTAITRSSRIANPGCFATCIQLGLIPLAARDSLNSEVHITAITGATGAGQRPVPTTHFAWRDNNLSVYKAFGHQHMDEILQSLTGLQPGFRQKINFIPMRGNFSRGIMASIYLDTKIELPEIVEWYEAYYQDSPFVHITQNEVSLKNVVNTNHCLIQLAKYGDKLHIISVIDNLLKGAAGQAVQNMNLVFSFPEDEGLRLKGSAF